MSGTRAMDYGSLETRFSGFLSERAATRTLQQFWDMKPQRPGTIELAAGMPNAGLFPVSGLDVKVSLEPFGEESARGSVSLRGDELPLARSLQYSETNGLPQLRKFVRQFLLRTGNQPGYVDGECWDVTLANGSNDSMFKFFETFCDSSSTLLCEEFTFTPAVSIARATGAQVVPVKLCLESDRAAQGLDTDHLEHLLRTWQTGPYKNLPRPKILYTVATGQNPTGVTISVTKRRKIYELAQEFDFLILEDDPYGYLSFTPFAASDPMHNSYYDDDMTVDKYVGKVLTPSFLTLDTDGRVIRLETFSKVFAPGMRLSFIVANKFIIDKIVWFAECTSRAPSGVSQALFHATVEAMAHKSHPELDLLSGSVESWIEWIMAVAKNYQHRRNVALKALYSTAAYREGLYTVIEPSAGMFVNIKINWLKFKTVNSKFTSAMIPELIDMLDDILMGNLVKVILGYKMAVSLEDSLDRCGFVRMAISYVANDEELSEACSRVGKGVMQFYNDFSKLVDSCQQSTPL